MNPEQIKSAVRWVVTTFGSVAAGFIAGKGWATSEQIMGVLTSDTFLQIIGTLVSLAAGAWGLSTHTETNAVAVVSEIAKQPESPVKAVITKPTVAGVELAQSIPGPTVVAAGTPQAKSMATAGAVT